MYLSGRRAGQRGLDLGGGPADLGAVTLPGPTRGAFDRPRDPDRGDHVAVPIADRSTHRGHARLALLDALGPAPRANVVAAQDLAGRSLVERQRGAQGDDRSQSVRRLERLDTDATIA